MQIQCILRQYFYKRHKGTAELHKIVGTILIRTLWVPLEMATSLQKMILTTVQINLNPNNNEHQGEN